MLLLPFNLTMFLEENVTLLATLVLTNVVDAVMVLLVPLERSDLIGQMWVADAMGINGSCAGPCCRLRIHGTAGNMGEKSAI
uniref:G_PROTEIN_RECEP_F1_2 domain-containing protein n=1 Tax=Angiostrongylus cantonensis TaxID=6313 RepID=A0A0K0DA14_ANGCA